MAITWTDSLREQVINEYKELKPTPENSAELVKGLADQHGATVNGIRMILIKAEVYVAVKKATSGATASTSDKPKKKTKAESLADLTKVLTDNDIEADDAIISKLTGKAADYFAEAFKSLTTEDEE